MCLNVDHRFTETNAGLVAIARLLFWQIMKYDVSLKIQLHNKGKD